MNDRAKGAAGAESGGGVESSLARDVTVVQSIAAAAIALALVVAVAACASRQPLPITPKADKPTSPVIRENLPAPATPPQPTPATGPVAASPESGNAPSTAPALAAAAPSSAAPRRVTASPPLVPAGTLYVCAGSVDGQPRYTAIEYVPRVKQLCARHPEMGVCQYEREACRASGGRVFDARGVEITKQIEAEYDRKVMRVRFSAG